MIDILGTMVHGLRRRDLRIGAAGLAMTLLLAAAFGLRAEPRRPPAAQPSPATSASRTPRAKPTTAPQALPTVTTRFSTGARSVALTFDDGPDPINTPKLLDLLKTYHVKATFCLVGFRVRAHKPLVRRIVAEGHTLCNHSWQHLYDLGKRPAKYLARDLEATNEQIHKAAPGARVAWFRAPYGNFSKRLNGFAVAQGMQPVGWNVDDECTRTRRYGNGGAMVHHMITTVRREVRPGSVILGHDNGKPTTVTAYRTLLPWLRARYTLTALPAA